MRRPHATLLLAALLLPASAPARAAGHEPPPGLDGLRFRGIGPSRGGRVTAVAGHPARPATFFMGATGGGVWKTSDWGQSWHPVSDGFFATGSIGAIRVAESDPDVVWVGTGSDGLRSNVIVGRGVYRSDDEGSTWQHVGLGATGNVGALLIHPQDPDRVWVAAIGNPFAPNPERGVFRTSDGGETWEHVMFVSERTGAVDLEFAPDDPDRIYASLWEVERKPWTIKSGGEEGGVFRSTDGGDTWTALVEGLPRGVVGKSDLATTAADPERVYVLVEAPGEAGGVYRSDDRGDNWRQVTAFQPIRNRPFYYTNLEAHPLEPDVLWGMAEGFWRSEDGGESWERRDTPHGDNHDMWINPRNPEIYIQSNDGGANVTRDGGATWSTQLNQPTAELYQVDVDDAFPYRLYAGQQDNSTISLPSRPPRWMPAGHTAHWEAVGGCETGPAVPKPGEPDVVYANCKGRFGLYDRRTGQEKQYYVGFWNIYGHNPRDLAYRFQRVAPIAVSPHDPDRVYHGSQFVHVTTDGGVTWETISPDLTAFTPETQVVSGNPITLDVTGEEHFSTLYDIQESPHEPGVIWAGANDGPVHLTRDGGATWTEVTPEELGPYGRVQQIEVSPHDPAKAYVSVLRYQLGDFRPWAFRTDDYGETWTRITTGDNGVPADHPVRVVREDPERPGLLYAGTEFGFFVSFDDGGRWLPFQQNLPVTPVTDARVVGDDLALSTMGRGFWILYGLQPLREWTPDAGAAAMQLFSVGPAFRLRGAAGSPPSARAPHEPDYPPGGAVVDYALSADLAGELTLEIRDAEGALVRRFSSEAAGERATSPAEPGMRAPEREIVGTSQLGKAAGGHRFVWDLRRAGPWHPDADRSGRDGPMVAPGTFTARLTSGGESLEQSFEVRLDPRVAAAGVTADDVREQEQLRLDVAADLSRARRAADRLSRAREQLAEGGGDEALEAIHAELVTAEVRYSQPMLVDQLAYLYRNLGQADQRPGRDALERHAELRARLDDVAARLGDALP